MKLIFLDIDGVLNSHKFYMTRNSDHEFSISNNIDPESIKLINLLVEQTGAQIIISSSWRILHHLDEINEGLKERGANFKAIAVTPRLTSNPINGRGNEIQAYIDTLSEKPTHFVIIDDDSDMGDLLPHLVKTSFYSGMTEYHLEQCKKMLMLP